MPDFYPLISRAVARLKVNTEATRRVLYEGLRQAVFTQRGRRAMEDALRKVEMEFSSQSQSKEPHSAEQVEQEIKRVIRKRRAESLLAIPLLFVLGSLLYMLVGLELLVIPGGIFQIIGLMVLVFIAVLIFVISRAIVLRIWQALH
jgi:cation transport ATPase